MLLRLQIYHGASISIFLRSVSGIVFFFLFFVGNLAADKIKDNLKINKGDWSHYSYDYSNSNNNNTEHQLSKQNVSSLVRAWETFNDDSEYPFPAPTGFVLETALGLHFPSAVVGIISPPVIQNGTIYYIDSLGTLFARDAKSGTITDHKKHWTTHLVDPDFKKSASPLAPELYYTAPMLTEDHIWLVGSIYGRLHAIERIGGKEIDFDKTTPEIDPYVMLPTHEFGGSQGEGVIVKTAVHRSGNLEQSGDASDRNQILLIRGLDVIVNDAIIKGGNVGLILALDITDPKNPKEVWRTHSVEINPLNQKRFGAGVSTGSGLAVDTERHLIFGGTGQFTAIPYDGYPAEKEPNGFIDRSDSLWAMDYLTGKFVWVNQFHKGDVFNLNIPESAGPALKFGPRDSDVLSPPVLFTAKLKTGEILDMVGNGSKGGIYRAVDRDTGRTIWERKISKTTGLGGIQAGAAYANGNIYVAGFEGIDDGFSDAQFDVPGYSQFLNAFFATFSPKFWADVEDTVPDNNPATGMRVKVYSLDAATGKSNWHFPGGRDYVELLAGAAMRHVSIANGLVFVTTSSGKLFALDADNGEILFTDQTPDLNELMGLGLGKPHHASMNAGTVISNGMIYVPYGGQNNPSGGIFAYKIGERVRLSK